MTATNEPGAYDNMISWLESEVRSLKPQIDALSEQLQQERAQIRTFADEWQRAEDDVGNVGAQLQILSALPEEMRFLRERIERVQGALAQDQEGIERLARQLRAEMQAERDERGELRRRTDFAEQAAQTGAESAHATEEIIQRLQESVSEQDQRLEQNDINAAGLNARIAANTEALRRAQNDTRALSGEWERQQRGFAEMGERIDRSQKVVRRMQEHLARSEEVAEEADALRDRFESMRVNNEQAIERLAGVLRDHEMMQARLAESDRDQERARSRADQHERALNELHAAFDALRESIRMDNERLLGFQEKQRRQRIADLEQEIRELRGYVRAQSESDA